MQLIGLTMMVGTTPEQSFNSDDCVLYDNNSSMLFERFSSLTYVLFLRVE